jgi:hypothetical protein
VISPASVAYRKTIWSRSRSWRRRAGRRGSGLAVGRSALDTWPRAGARG